MKKIILLCLALSLPAMALDCSTIAGKFETTDLNNNITLEIDTELSLTNPPSIRHNGATYQTKMEGAFEAVASDDGESCVATGYFNKRILGGQFCKFSVEHSIMMDAETEEYSYQLKFMKPTVHIAKCMHSGYETIESGLKKNNDEPIIPLPEFFSVGGSFSYTGGFASIEVENYTPAAIRRMKVDLISSCGAEKIYSLSYAIGGDSFVAIADGSTGEFDIREEHAGEVIDSFSLTLNGKVDAACDIPFLVK